MPKNEILDNIRVDKLILSGKGLATAPDGKKIIISGGCIPGSIVRIRVLKAKKSHYEGQQIEVIKKSPIEVPLPEGFQLYGGAKWLTIGYDDQLSIKETQVREAFFHLQAYTNGVTWHSIIPSPEIYGYRNKLEFSWGKYISLKEGVHDEFRFGFHAQGQFDRIENCVYCALADDEINAIFRTVDEASRSTSFPTYDPKTNEGFWRHLVIRKAKKTGEIMVIFSINSAWEEGNTQKQNTKEYIFTNIVRQLTEKYKHIVSVYFLENTGRADIVTGNPVLISGKAYIEEELLGLRFEIQPKSFFQVNSLGAELLYKKTADFIHHKGGTLLDLYAGTGTIGIMLSPQFSHVYSVELVPDASRDGERNALKNGITNVHFKNEKVEDFALHFDQKADTIVLDPPRDGLHPSALPYIRSFAPREIIYVSCNPATLVRDLEILLATKGDDSQDELPNYRITDIAPFDMFPHTHHIETIVRLERNV